MKNLRPPERRALLAMIAVAVAVLVSLFEIGQRNFWFEPKNTYYTHVPDADGLREGGLVTMAGLRIGEVAALDVDQANTIIVTLKVRRAYGARIRRDSLATVVSTTLLGEKRVDISPGTPENPILPGGGTLPARGASGLSDLLTGKKLAELVGRVDSLLTGLDGLIKQVGTGLTGDQTTSLAASVPLVAPVLRNLLQLTGDMLVMTREMKKQSKALPVFVASGADLLTGMRDDFFKTGLARDTATKLDGVLTPLAARQQLVTQLLNNLSDLSHDLAADPAYGRKVLQAVSELTITLKALQKTWLLEDQAAEVRQEQQRTSP